MSKIICMVVFVLLVVANCDESIHSNEPLFLTPLINSGQIDLARKLALVNLPEAQNITSYSGLFTINERYQSNLFHWYFEAEIHPETAPILLWLNGGPGTSSLLGLLEEHGPFSINNDMTLKFRQWYWTKNHHVIYLENPVGVGYSFTNNKNGYAHSTKDCAEGIYQTLLQFFKMFPELNNNDFYLAGESYGGKYVPATASVLLDRGGIPNFRGVIIGNGLTDPEIQQRGVGEYLYQQGFVDEHERVEYARAEKYCQKVANDYQNGRNNVTVEEMIDACRTQIDPFSNSTIFANTTGYLYTYNILYSEDPTKQSAINRERYVQLPRIRKAIHVGNLIRQDNPSIVQINLGGSLLESEKEHVEKILNSSLKLRALIYNGQLDVMVPYRLTVNYLKTLNFPERDIYEKAAREIWQLDETGEVAGYVKHAGGLNEVMVVGAGHMVPLDQPKRAFDLINKFTKFRL